MNGTVLKQAFKLANNEIDGVELIASVQYTLAFDSADGKPIIF